MIAYSATAYIANIFQREGSVLPGTFITCLLPAAICFFAMLCFRGYVGEDCKEKLITSGDDDRTPPFAAKVYAILLGYILVFRVNMAFSRYWEGVSNLQIMFTNWLDSFLLASSYISQSTQVADCHVALKLEELSQKLAHWYTLMSALAIFRLRDFTEPLESLIITRSDEICELINHATEGRKAEYNSNGDLLFCPTAKFLDDPNPSNAKKRTSTLAYKLEKHLGTAKGTYTAYRGLDILGNLTQVELESIKTYPDKVAAVAGWITATMGMSESMGWISTPAPILTRTSQELSEGLRGYSQAVKVSVVPFPFPFAQLIILNLVVFFVLCPLMLAYYTNNIIVAPIATWVITMGYWGLNNICNELENPYGDAANHLPLIMLHKDFVTQIDDIRKMRLPKNIQAEWEGFDSK